MASVVIKKEAKAEGSRRKAFKMNEMSFFHENKEGSISFNYSPS
jgi:hypothetical protein